MSWAHAYHCNRDFVIAKTSETQVNHTLDMCISFPPSQEGSGCSDHSFICLLKKDMGVGFLSSSRIRRGMLHALAA